MFSIVEENYLKSLFTLSLATGEVNVNELSKRLNIKMPSVTNMMKKFSLKGLVYYEQYKPIKLTPLGRKEAALVIRKHRLVEMFLVEKLKFAWDEVHEIAEQIEHVNSTLFFDKLDASLGFPKVDPHGSPIPDKFGRFEPMGAKKLSDCSPDEQVRIIAVANSSSEFLRFLTVKGISLGTKLSILHIEPFDLTLTVEINDNSKESFSHQVCQNLFVS